MVQNDIERIDIEYEAQDYVNILQKMDSLRKNNARASLSWRLTTREKVSVVANISSLKNRDAIERLKKLLEQ
jgi:hypothetical protein